MFFFQGQNFYQWALFTLVLIISVFAFLIRHLWPPSSTTEEPPATAPSTFPISRGDFFLRQRQLAIPGQLRPDKLHIPEPILQSLKENLQVLEKILTAAGFYSFEEWGRTYFIGPFGELLTIQREEGRGLVLLYAPDFSWANAHGFEELEDFPVTRQEDLLPSAASFVQQYVILSYLETPKDMPLPARSDFTPRELSELRQLTQRLQTAGVACYLSPDQQLFYTSSGGMLYRLYYSPRQALVWEQATKYREPEKSYWKQREISHCLWIAHSFQSILRK